MLNVNLTFTANVPKRGWRSPFGELPHLLNLPAGDQRVARDVGQTIVDQLLDLEAGHGREPFVQLGEGPAHVQPRRAHIMQVRSRGAERLGHVGESVGEGRDARDADASPGQGSGDLAGVRVARLADGQLRTDAQELCREQPPTGR